MVGSIGGFLRLGLRHLAGPVWVVLCEALDMGVCGGGGGRIGRGGSCVVAWLLWVYDFTGAEFALAASRSCVGWGGCLFWGGGCSHDVVG